MLNSLMSTVFMESNNIPAAIKCLFDYLDSKTDLLNPTARLDTEIAHVWKTNRSETDVFVIILPPRVRIGQIY